MPEANRDLESVGHHVSELVARHELDLQVGVTVEERAEPRARNQAQEERVFVTTKAWHDKLSSAAAIRNAFDTSLSKLKLDYVDMYMLHCPSAQMDMKEVTSALGALREEGRTRAIGVCNFNLPMLRQAVEELQAPIAAVQVEYHPFLDQSKLLAFLGEKNIPPTAYAPLAQGRAASDETLLNVGKKHGVSGAHVAIAWLLDQAGVIATPKAQRLESQRSNFAALDVWLRCWSVAGATATRRPSRATSRHDLVTLHQQARAQ